MPEPAVIRVVREGDRPAVERFLEGRLAFSMFLLSNLRSAGLADHGERLQGTYIARWRGDEVVGVAAHYRMGNLTLSAPDGAWDLAREVLAETGRPVAGLVGPADQVDEVADGLGLQARADAVYYDEREVLYRLDLAKLVAPDALANGTVRGRRLANEDVETARRWAIGYHVESLGTAETEALAAKVQRQVDANLGSPDFLVLEHEGRLVAQTGFNARLDMAVQIGGVWTPPELRGRGYARCAVAAHLLAAREAGVRTGVLFTSEDNVAARRAYEALGFEPIGHYRIVLLEPAKPAGVAPSC